MVSDGNPAASFEAGAPSPTVSEIFSAGLGETSLQLTQVADRRKLFAFAALWDLTLDVFEIPGGFVAACSISFAEPSSFAHTTASGNGFTIAQAVLSCLGEAVEVASWLYRLGDRDRLVESVDTSLPMLSADAVLGFSPAQIRHRRRLNDAWDGYDAIPPPAELSKPHFWSKVSSFGGKDEAWCPAFLPFGGLGEIEAGDRTMNADSNGCAAGATMEVARERAVLELIERDATGIWWWRGCYRDRIPTESFGGTVLGNALMEHAEFSGRRLWFLDISAWRSAATVAAVSCGGDLRRVAVGFAAAFSLYDAARKAFLELIQTELAIEAHEVRKAAASDSSGLSTECALEKWLKSIDLSRLDFVLGTEEAPAGSTDDAVSARSRHLRRFDLLPPALQPHEPVGSQGLGACDELLAELAANGHPMWFADLERPEIGIPVTKAFCEGLAHFRPRLGCRRLWTVPRVQGWRTMFGGETARRPPPLLV